MDSGGRNTHMCALLLMLTLTATVTVTVTAEPTPQENIPSAAAAADIPSAEAAVRAALDKMPAVAEWLRQENASNAGGGVAVQARLSTCATALEESARTWLQHALDQLAGGRVAYARLAVGAATNEEGACVGPLEEINDAALVQRLTDRLNRDALQPLAAALKTLESLCGTNTHGDC